MPVNASFGVFPSGSAVRSKSTSDLQRLYFRTTQKYEHDWRTIPEEDKGENFDQIHNIGKRTTKYMKFQKKVAPLVDRTACTHRMEYVPRPLGDCQTNKELAATFRGDKKYMSTPSLGGDSNYKETFVPFSRQQHNGAKQKSCAPKRGLTATLGGTDDFMECESSMHRTFPIHPMELAKVTPSATPKPNLTMSSTSAGEFYRSQYHRDFHPSRVAPNAPTRWEDYMPGPSPFTLADDSIYRCRRACFLSPGN
eukprot:TRINITY_DN21776_c0_g1_i1.p1 TRINITY_DN21776_c0_g1~~TRINITY_DN21776_c0_g1_i1.p1  ORF type:complete len:252 (+),score=27.70 TRINITY_DN21776_c0_g1_i1:139-894(+)